MFNFPKKKNLSSDDDYNDIVVENNILRIAKDILELKSDSKDDQQLLDDSFGLLACACCSEDSNITQAVQIFNFSNF